MKELIIYGIHPILEAIESGETIDKVLIQKNLQGNNAQELQSLLRKKNVRIQYVPIEKLNKLTRNNHQGVVAYVSPVTYYPIDELIHSSFENGNTPFFLILDRITDVRNFGAIVRSAECTGVDGIIISEKGSAPINADALKTSAGAFYHMKICKESNLDKSIQLLQSSGIQVVGASEKSEKLIYEEDLKKPLAIVMGSEEDGLSTKVYKSCDAVAKIPIQGNTDSLNVSVACGVFLYEVVRQRL